VKVGEIWEDREIKDQDASPLVRIIEICDGEFIESGIKTKVVRLEALDDLGYLYGEMSTEEFLEEYETAEREK